MEEIKVDDSTGKITYNLTEEHDENSLLDKYQNEFMAFRVAEAQENKAPQIIEGMKAHIELSEGSIKLNNEKQEMFKQVFEENGIDYAAKIKEIKEKYSDDELMDKAKNLIYSQKTSIEKEHGNFVYQTQISQTAEELVIDFMRVQDELPELLERLAKQKQQVKAAEEKLEKIQQAKKEIQERLRRIKVFFANQHKNVDKLLDARAQARPKGKSVAKALPTVGEEETNDKQ